MLELASGLLVTACSAEKAPSPPTEQEIHALDRGAPGGVRGRHVFRCDDGKRLLVDFKDQGLTLEIREREADPPLVLTAPSQGLQYQGGADTATVVAGGLRIQPATGGERVCTRRTN